MVAPPGVSLYVHGFWFRDSWELVLSTAKLGDGGLHMVDERVRSLKGMFAGVLCNHIYYLATILLCSEWRAPVDVKDAMLLS